MGTARTRSEGPSRDVRRGRPLFWLLLAALLVVALESISYVGLFLLRGQWFSPAESARTRQWIAAQTQPQETEDGGTRWQVLHPYAGFVADADREGGRIDRHGFLNPRDAARRDDDYRIGIFGGSVAMAVAAKAGGMVKSELEKVPQLRGRRVVVRNFAQGGFKQPQQLIVLSYFLALGEPLDAVVNLDGFNEVALPWIDHVQRGVFPFYPMNWPLWTGGASGSPEALRLVGKISLLRQRRAQAGRLCPSLLRYSPTCELLWRGLDSSWSRRISAAQQELAERTSDGRRFRTHGPERPYGDRAALFSDLVDHWRRCSLLMHQICAANGIRYHHFLQPNQYAADSKPLSPEEQRIAVLPGYRGGEAVAIGYPLLAAAGEDLVAAGVRFHDLRRLFSDRSETLYRDSCCHYNRRGLQIVARRIGRALAADVSG